MKSHRLHWAGHVYYYGAALVGLGFILYGLVGIYSGLLQAALPRSAPEFQWRVDETALFEREPPAPDATPLPTPSPAEIRRLEREAAEDVRGEGLYSALGGLGATVVGAPVFVWHIRRARRLEVSGQD